MRVIKPSDQEHTITIIPRSYTIGTTVMTITNEGDKSVTEATHSVSRDGNMYSLTFTLDTTEGSKYSYVITNETETLYVGRLIATEQDAQEYNPTTKYYTYE